MYIAELMKTTQWFVKIKSFKITRFQNIYIVSKWLQGDKLINQTCNLLRRACWDCITTAETLTTVGTSGVTPWTMLPGEGYNNNNYYTCIGYTLHWIYTFQSMKIDEINQEIQSSEQKTGNKAGYFLGANSETSFSPDMKNVTFHHAMLRLSMSLL